MYSNVATYVARHRYMSFTIAHYRLQRAAQRSRSENRPFVLSVSKMHASDNVGLSNIDTAVYKVFVVNNNECAKEIRCW